MSAAEIFKEKVTKKISENTEKVKKINSIYEFIITDEEKTFTVDLTKDADFVTEGSTGQAKCVVSIKSEDLIALLEKKLNPQMAFMTGKIKIKGDMGLALKLGSIL